MKITSIGILFATLLIGFAIGFLTNGYVARQRIGTVKEFTTEEGYKQMLLSDLGITDSQKQLILPLVEENFELIRMMNQIHYADLKNINDSLYTQIAKKLNTNQQLKLADKRTEFKQNIQKLQTAIKKSTPITKPTEELNRASNKPAPPDTVYYAPPKQKDTLQHVPFRLRPPKQAPPPRPLPQNWQNLSQTQRDSIKQFREEQRKRLSRSDFDSLRNSPEWQSLTRYQKWWLEKQDRQRKGDTTAMPPPPPRWNERVTPDNNQPAQENNRPPRFRDRPPREGEQPSRRPPPRQ